MKKTSLLIIVVLVIGCLGYSAAGFAQVPWDGYHAAPGAPPWHDPYYYHPSRHNDQVDNRDEAGNHEQDDAVVAHLDDAAAWNHRESGLNDNSRSVSKYNVDRYDNVANHWEENGRQSRENYNQYFDELLEFINNEHQVSDNDKSVAEVDSSTEINDETQVQQRRRRHVVKSEHRYYRNHTRVLSKFNVDSYVNTDGDSSEYKINAVPDNGVDTAEYDEATNDQAIAITNNNYDNSNYSHYNNDNLFPKVYSLLTADEKSVYDAIYPGVSDAEDSITMSGQFERQVIKNAVYALMQDHPEFIWLEGSYTYTYYENQNMTKLELDYNAFASDPSKYKKEMEDAAAVLIAEARKYKTPEAMERYLFEQLKTNIDYVESDYDQTAYSALVWHKSVCRGSAMAFKYLLNQVGIPSFVVSSDSHAWNIVQINGQWYYADAVAYTTPKGRDSAVKNGDLYERFNVTSSEYPETPQWDKFPNDRLPRAM